jgi:hypothetical protein
MIDATHGIGTCPVLSLSDQTALNKHGYTYQTTKSGYAAVMPGCVPADAGEQQCE